MTRRKGAGAKAARVSPGSARSLLLTLLGEFLYPENRPAWTSPLLHGLAGVGIAEKAGRQALARAAQAGWMESTPSGRRAEWRLTDHGRRLISEGSRRLRSLRAEGARWGGEWLVLHVTLPEARREDRLRTYRALAWLGFGNPTPGIWISPDPARAPQAKQLIADLRLGELTLALQAKPLDFGVPPAVLVRQAWDLDAVAAHYEDLVKRFLQLRPRTPDDILFAHIELVNALQRLPSLDPGLPPELLPSGWTRRLQADRLWALRERWHAPAHARWDELAAQVDS